MSAIKAMLSSNDNSWETPDEFFRSLNEVFRFETDVCATHMTAKCTKYYTPEDDGLSKDWTGTCWMNPPYGREIPRWVEKAYKESLKGATVVCLIPSRTDTAYWHDFVLGGGSNRDKLAWKTAVQNGGGEEGSCTVPFFDRHFLGVL
jgi:phage N-6-adenine-methyltransferase